MLKTTPLNAVHRALDARMVDFGGWDMPVHYGSQIEEHHAVRRDAGMFDVSHMLAIDMHGAGARDFLRRALANNTDKLRDPGRALYSCMLNDAGGVIDDLIVYLFADEFFRLVVNAGRAEKDLAWLTSLKERFGATLELRPRRDLAMIAVQGPNARERVWQALPGTRAATEAMRTFHALQSGELMLARTGYTGEDGFELVLPAARAEALWRQLIGCGVKPCGLGARDTLRLEAGMNLWGQDMDEGVSPLDAGLAWTVDLESARDFVGKAALRARRAGSSPASYSRKEAACCAATRKCSRRRARARSPAARFRRRWIARSRSRASPWAWRPARWCGCRCETSSLRRRW